MRVFTLSNFRITSSKKLACRLVALLIAFFTCAWRCNAQEMAFNGHWYIIYNDNDPLSTGEEFEIKIEGKGGRYHVFNTGGTYAAFVPDTGNYIISSDGCLQRGETKLRFKKDRMFFEDRGRVEFINKEKTAKIEVYIKMASLLLDKSDTIKNSSKRRDSLRRSLYYIKKALELGQCRECYYDKCLADFKLGKIDSAVQDMVNVEGVYPGYPKTPALRKMLANYYMRNAWEQYGKKEKYSEALLEYQRAVFFDPENADVWYNIGGAYYNSKQYDKAIEAFKKSIMIAPSDIAQKGLEAAQSALEDGDK